MYDHGMIGRKYAGIWKL
ncbi:hypothetical protein Q0N58_04140 [Staphylococcus aureus]|nr:hypothetical protein [Staphylococcus aureus]